jgi:hypothetical protein
MSIENGETIPQPEQQPIKEQWLGELSEFLVEASRNTWAGDGAEVKPERQGYKELRYRRGPWVLRDSYTGYFRAPGMTTVYYESQPAWTMAYGGQGQVEAHYEESEQTFEFLKAALMHVTPELPIRGPRLYSDADKHYTFDLLEGALTDGVWKEEIAESGNIIFRQFGIVGLVIPKDAQQQPVYPWNNTGR